ncbi:hypothetical protein HPB52_001802 [Rhipicephalus sanguineus]|uniref:Elongation of very long chain fatty acids protein n=1 Tax=Rhipicephalus sanguineus TaxID=34632 RepID=A0A9D4QGC2_RHISA|nr:hypothetical protein HPB52_001802 [Rhipicephalus sanguineus]
MRVSVGPERLLGACLIAKPPRPAWAGVPLIALPPSPPLDEQIVSLSQLALHAQGSPLVLAPRGRKPLATADEPTPPSTPDSALAADEAQAPLPRVLKPRKRRKRERAASAPGGPGPPTAPSALCACALCCRAAAYPTPPVSPLRDWDDFRCECASFKRLLDRSARTYPCWHFGRHSGLDFSGSANSIEVADPLWWYMMVRIVDFLDTVFFLPRKKDSQASVLHVGYHVMVVVTGWFGVTYGPDVGWRRYLTRLQIVHFMIMLLLAPIPLFVDCGYPLAHVLVVMSQVTFYSVMFVRFYMQAYRKRAKAA